MSELDATIQKIEAQKYQQAPLFSSAGDGPWKAKFPDPCMKCQKPNTVTRAGYFCAECTEKMHIGSGSV